jgi:hypothetical protein
VLKSLIVFLRYVLIDLSTWCGTSTTLDLKTIERRAKHEGLSFLTITLANFGKDFQKSLDQGFVGNDQFPGFSRTGGLPRFLSGFLCHVFDASSGRLIDTPCINCIRAIRQLSLMFSKMEIDCTPLRVTAAIRRYIDCEYDVRLSDQKLISESDRLERFARVGRMLWAEFFSAVDTRIYQDSVVPKHGPGSTADKLRGNAKYKQQTWTRRLDDVFPYWEHIFPNERPLIEGTHYVHIIEPGAEIPVKVITVPKTLKTPRIIAIEPTCMQYMQQGILAVMMKQMSRSDNARHFVMSESQEPNQRLAREGSITGALATLDLSEASDRVSNQHVRLLLSNHKFLREAVDATRSRKADVPGFGVQRLAKFASMGSALCFPFEALVFCTIVFVGIERALNRPLTIKDIKSFYGKVRVYGDDIIVPVEYVLSVNEELEAFGFRVNHDKSFWTGKFRESCGKDYYFGKDVSVTKIRRFLPIDIQQAKEIVSAVSLRNHLALQGFSASVTYLDRLISEIIPFPAVEAGSPLLGRHEPWAIVPTRHDTDLHRPLVKGAYLSSKLPKSHLSGYEALLKIFLTRGATPLEDRDHLRFAGRPSSARIKTRWSTPYGA